MDNDSKKIIELLDSINNKIEKVDMRLAFGSKKLDRFMGQLNLNSTQRKNINEIDGDLQINISITEYLKNEGFVKCALTKDSMDVCLTNKGKALVLSGGFSQIELNEKLKKVQEEKNNHWWQLKMSIAQWFVLLLSTVLSFVLGKSCSI